MISVCIIVGDETAEPGADYFLCVLRTSPAGTHRPGGIPGPRSVGSEASKREIAERRDPQGRLQEESRGCGRAGEARRGVEGRDREERPAHRVGGEPQEDRGHRKAGEEYSRKIEAILIRPALACVRRRVSRRTKLATGVVCYAEAFTPLWPSRVKKAS